MDTRRLVDLLPSRARYQVESLLDALAVFREIQDPKVLASLGPAGVRGLVLQRGKQGTPTRMPASHHAHFDWSYPSDQPEMAELYRRAKRGQWDGETALDWSISVDPLDPTRPLIPEDFIDIRLLEARGVRLDARERRRLVHSVTSWMLSQFLHGEQGALFAAAQVTEAVQFFDGKLYGATQVMDEGRHVEVFRRYLDDKMGRLYQINDNLFVIIDSLMTDSRWDMKFLGMQIMVEGLALGAFGTLYRLTGEPLLKSLLKNVIQDEARHVHYGVVALREHFAHHITAAERREREDWSFEVALLMRNRFMAFEVYEEWFEGRLSRDDWKQVVVGSRGMEEFRRVMFSRLMPNLREIGLLRYMDGAAADKLSGDGMIAELDRAA